MNNRKNKKPLITKENGIPPNFTLSIADITINIQCPGLKFFRKIYKHYSHFLSSEKPEFEFLVFPEPNMKGITTPLTLKKHSENSYRLEGAMTGIISLKKCTAEIHLPADAVVFDGLLRMILGALILEKGGLLLHASGVIRRNLAWVFFGPSESGKTTITKLCLSDPVLSDEIVAIRKDSAERYIAYATPFHGKWKSGTNIPPAHLAALFYPVKSSILSVHKIPAPDAVKLILPQVIMHPKIEKSPEHALENVACLVDKIPCYSLKFLLDHPLGDLIDKLADKGVALTTGRMERS
ncbi:MAG: hypothetical protein AB1546_10710 [bacterium]